MWDACVRRWCVGGMCGKGAGGLYTSCPSFGTLERTVGMLRVVRAGCQFAASFLVEKHGSSRDWSSSCLSASAGGVREVVEDGVR